MARREPIFKEPAWLILMVAGVLWAVGCLVAAAGVLLLQAMHWLKVGVWLPISAYSAWDVIGVHLPLTNWVGAERIIDRVVQWAAPAPLAWTLVLFGLAPLLTIILGLNWLLAISEDWKRAAATRKRRGPV